MVNEFQYYPPLFEVARTQVLLPGDEGYESKSVPKHVRMQALEEAGKTFGKAPDYIRKGMLKLKGMLSDGRR